MRNTLLFLILIQFAMNAQICIDDSFQDWSSISDYGIELGNDNAVNGVDFKKIKISDEVDYIYFYFETDQVINLQEHNEILLSIDLDNNENTGLAINGIGADMTYNFNDRSGVLRLNGFNWSIYHKDIALVSLPSFAGNKFEIRVSKSINYGTNANLRIESAIRFCFHELQGDIAPDQDITAYSFQNLDSDLAISLGKKLTDDIRILSYNVLQDGYFNDERKPSFDRIISALAPDIFAFQEIYGHNEIETRNQVAGSLNISPTSLYSSRVNPDIVLISKFPILQTETINGNGIFLVEAPVRNLLIINVHFPCCNNDFDRQIEIENITAYIEDLKSNNASIDIDYETPILVLGDMNLVGSLNNYNSLIYNNQDGISNDMLDWDGSKLEDTKPKVTGENAAYTWSNDASSYSSGRLDFFIYTGSISKINHSYILKTENLRAQDLLDYNLAPLDTKIASDHLPMVIDISPNILNNLAPALISDPITIYPNPTANRLNISLDFAQKNCSFLILNNFGEKVLNGQIKNQKSIDLKSLKTGLYYIQISSDAKMTTKKFIKI